MIPFGSSLGVLSLTSGTPSGAVCQAPLAATTAPPVVAAPLPLAAAPGVKAATDRPGSREPAPVELQCAVGNCRDRQANYHTGFCEAHQERFMTRVYDQTRHIGRGEL